MKNTKPEAAAPATPVPSAPKASAPSHRAGSRAAAAATAATAATQASTAPAATSTPPTSAPAAAPAATSTLPVSTPTAPRKPRTSIGKLVTRFLGKPPVMGFLGVVAISALVFGMLRVLPSHASTATGSGDIRQINWHAAAQAPDASFEFGPYFTSFGEGLLMLGTSASGTAVWSSPDGSSWTQVSNSGSFATDGRRFVALGFADDGAGGLVVVGNSFTVGNAAGNAAGNANTGNAVGGGIRAAAWHSRDGRTWTAAQVDSPDGGQMLAVSALPGALVAAGNGSAWFSQDGKSWSRQSLPNSGGFQPSLVGTWGGGFVLVAQSSGVAAARVWTSENGTSWTPASTSLNGFVARDLSGNADRMVLAGSDLSDDNAGRAASWSSTDGNVWTRATAPISSPVVPMTSVTEIAGTLVAVGDSAIAGNALASGIPTPPLSIWVSGDAAKWQPLASTATPLARTRLAVLGNRLILAGTGTTTHKLEIVIGDVVAGSPLGLAGSPGVAGSQGSAGPLQTPIGAVLHLEAGSKPMIADLQEGFTLGPVVATTDRFFTFIDGDAGYSIWSSPNGRLWSQETTATLLPAGANGVRADVAAGLRDGAGGAVAVGRITGGASDVPGVWRYTKEKGWHPASIEGTAAPKLSSVAVHGTSFVAGTTSPTGARILYSDDGEIWRPATITGADGAALTVGSWSGGFVATGAGASSQAPSRTWTSPDGHQWTERQDWFTPAHATAVFGMGSGLVAATSSSGSNTTWWWSADGSIWIQSGLAVADPNWTMAGDQLLVLQRPLAKGGVWQAWTSKDGQSWQSAASSSPTFDEGTPYRLAAAGQVILFVGTSVEGDLLDYYGDLTGN